MMSNKQLEANRQNALRSTGPTTPEGVQGCKHNALRHGLRALQTVVPGEDPGEWEVHLAEVVTDLDPQGAVELALAEQVAVKLWRLGRVVRHEADLIANSVDQDELFRAHEMTYQRGLFDKLVRTDIPTRKDVTSAQKDRDQAEEKLSYHVEALRQLKALATMKDEEPFENWALYAVLRDQLRLSDERLEILLNGETDRGPFLARHARRMLTAKEQKSGSPEEFREALAKQWAERQPELEKEAGRLRSAARAVRRRYLAALERRRRAHGLPGAKDLDRIQRYEAHLERGLHKTMDRLRDLQAARGAVPPPAPSVAVAVVQAGPESALAGQMGPFGSFALEAPDRATEPAESAR
jgi:hypothetical protein